MKQLSRRSWFFAAFACLTGSLFARNEKKKFLPGKWDGVSRISLHPPSEEFPIPHLHTQWVCGMCGSTSDVLIWNEEGQFIGAIYADKRETRKQQAKLGVNPSCIRRCASGFDELDDPFGEMK